MANDIAFIRNDGNFPAALPVAIGGGGGGGGGMGGLANAGWAACGQQYDPFNDQMMNASNRLNREREDIFLQKLNQMNQAGNIPATIPAANPLLLLLE